MDGSKKADQAKTTGRARGLGMALFDFESEYGSFPDHSTAARVKARTGSTLPLGGSTSNDYFRQLIAAGIIQAERDYFYAPLPYVHEADNRIDGVNALAAGEVGFGYFLDGTAALRISDDSVSGHRRNPGRPLAATPLLNPGSSDAFDPRPFDGKAILLRADNSVVSYPIRPNDGRVIVAGGKDLLQPGDDTVWGDGATPKIAPPLKK